MATQSFTTDFKFTRKSSGNLLSALQNASVVNDLEIRKHKEQYQSKDVKSEEDILSILNSLNSKENSR